MLASALPAGIPADLGATARDTLGGALSVAAQLTDPIAAAALTLTAQAALSIALHATSAIGFVISIASAIAAAIYRAATTHGPLACPNFGGGA